MERTLEKVDNTRESVVSFWHTAGRGLHDIWRNARLGSVLVSCLAGIVFGLACLISPLLGIVLGGGILVLVMSFSRPVVLCYLVISTTILMSGIERGRLFPLLTGNEIGLLGAVGIALVMVLAGKRRKIVISNYYWLAFGLLVGGTVFIPTAIFLLQGVQLTFDNAFKMFGLIQYFLLFWLFAAIPQNEGDRRTIIWWMLAFGLIVAVVGLAQGAGVGFVRRLLEYLYASSHESVAARAGRVTSLLGSWNGLGIFMMAVCLICWALLLEVNRSDQRLLIVGIMALSILCLIASGSYAGILGLGIGLFIILVLSRRRGRSVPMLILVVFAAIPVVALAYPVLQPLVAKRLADQYEYGGWIPQTLLYRMQVWHQIFIPAIQAHFPWAVYPTVPSYYAWQFEESQYILLLFRTGLVGLISYVAWIVITISWLYRRYQRSQGSDRAVASAALATVVVLVIAGFTNEVFSFAGTIDYLWIMLALVANGMGRT